MNRSLRALLAVLAVVALLTGSDAAPVRRTLLLVAFQPFVGRKANVGEDIADALDGAVVAAGENRLAVRAVVLPVEWGQPEPRIRQAIQAARATDQTPVDVLVLGELDAGPVTVDRGAANRRGLNLIDFGPDGSKTPGQRGLGARIAPSDPLGAWHAATLFEAIRDGLARAGIEFTIGEDAGPYLCGEALYVSGQLSPAAGSLHVPAYPVSRGDRTSPENRAHLATMRAVVVKVIEEIAKRDPAEPVMRAALDRIADLGGGPTREAAPVR